MLTSKPLNDAQVIQAVRAAPGSRVKVAVSDIDGILRGKYIHKEKFYSAAESGFGFCDVVFGWDSHDVCYDNTKLTGWHNGFPTRRADRPATFRTVPWDDHVPFFLGNFIRPTRQGGAAADLPAAGAEARAEARREARASP
jgi:glutamine synthetase